MARKYAYNTSADALLAPAKGAVFFEDWEVAVDHANHDLLCAEMSRLAYADEKTVTASLAQIGFSPIGFLGGDTLAGRTAAKGTQGFVAKHPAQGLTILAFRGTEAGRFEDLVSDLDTVQTDFPGGGRIHSGFLKAYRSVTARIETLLEQRTGTLLITGHSLGAALATVAVAAMAPAPDKLITFGSPRVGDRVFGELIKNRLAPEAVHRFVGCCDIVTRVPPERFDAGHFSKLFGELGNFDGLNPFKRKMAEAVAAIAAKILAQGFRALRPPLEFVHVAPPRYIRFDGSVVDHPGEATQSQDQRAARAAYPHSTANQFDRLQALFKALHATTSGPSELRAFIHRLFGLARGDPVPLRDLADHAPINYVSGVTGRV